MAHSGSHSGPATSASRGFAASLVEQSQLDFELNFFAAILNRHPEFAELLRVHGNNLTLAGRIDDGLEVDRRLIVLKPHDPLAHYKLACSLALLRKADLAIQALRRAVELGYRDFRYMREDHDLAPLHNDARFKKLLREFEDR